jgi:hypothetical protein
MSISLILSKFHLLPPNTPLASTQRHSHINAPSPLRPQLPKVLDVPDVPDVPDLQERQHDFNDGGSIMTGAFQWEAPACYSRIGLILRLYGPISFSLCEVLP